MIGVLADVFDRLDELIVAVVAASSGGFIGGWMALRAANASIERSVQASKAERQAAEVESRRSTLKALEAELRLNAVLMRSEETDHSAVAPAWRIPFRDAYVAALPNLSSLPPEVQQSLQDAAVLSSHYSVIAARHNAQVGPGHGQHVSPELVQTSHDRLVALAPNVSDRFLEAANQLGGYLSASAPAGPGAA